MVERFLPGREDVLAGVLDQASAGRQQHPAIMISGCVVRFVGRTAASWSVSRLHRGMRRVAVALQRVQEAPAGVEYRPPEAGAAT